MTNLLAPDIGTIFTTEIDQAGPFPAKWRCSGWLKAWTPPPRDPNDWLQAILDESCPDFDKGNGPTKLVHCTRGEAEYVMGSGVAGCIKRVEDVVALGYVEWTHQMLEEARARAHRAVGRVVN